MADILNTVNTVKIKDLKKSKVRLEQEVLSVRDRIRDLEWKIDCTDADIEDLMNQRHRAIDKLRETQKDLLVVREQLIDLGVE